MPFITNKQYWYPLFGVVYVLLLWKGGKKGRISALIIIFIILSSDQLSAGILKPLFLRERPCVMLENVYMLIGFKISYSFPSAHAANSFTTATFFAFLYPKGKLVYFILASLVGFSRVYVGVHYPFDVLAGALLGSGCAYVGIYVFSLLAKSNFWNHKKIKFKRDLKKLPNE